MTEQEAWRPVDGFGGRYEVSSWGRVRSRNGRGPRGSVPRLLKPMTKPEGYQHVDLYRYRTRVRRYVHALVAEAFLGPRPDGYVVNHRSGDKADNRLLNLEYLSRSANLRHAYRAGLRRPVGHPGASNPNASLSGADVAAMRSALERGTPVGVVARAHGVASQTVSGIKSGRRWGGAGMAT